MTRVQVTDNGRIVWLCRSCGDPIGDDLGVVEVDYLAACDQARKQEAWKSEHVINGLYRLESLSAYPEPVQWSAVHYKCEGSSGGTYWLLVDYLRTYRQVVSLAAHMMEKRWITSTDLPVLLAEIADAEETT